ncbi:MAG: hypothetical protein J6S74_03430 [Alphaproteobacteria bacterium]|nr:hypothetical protein [Alphaproteobacteria bacterium]
MVKKSFPGVSQKTINKNRAAEEKKRKRKEMAEKLAEAKRLVQEKEKKRNAVKRQIKFDTNEADGRFFAATTIGAFILGLATAIIGVLDSNKTYVQNDGGHWGGSYKEKYHGDGLFNGEYLVREWDPSKFDEVMFGISQVSLCVLILSICVLIGIREKHVKRDRNKDDAIDIMLEIKEKNPDFKLDEKKLKKLLKVVPDIISRMSKAERVWFDMLMVGDLEIVNDKTYRSMAITIMEGHLQSHPEDMKLILETFDENSIPGAIKEKYARKVR